MSTLLGISLLLFSWLFLYFFLLGLTEGRAALWDIAPVRPPVGNWQRTLNDFFESGIGAYLPAMIFLCINFFFYGRTVLKKGIYLASWVFGFTNLLALIALFIVLLISLAFIPDVPGHLTSDDWAYWGDFKRAWPSLLGTFLWFIAVVTWQPTLVDRVSERIRY